MLEYMQHMDGAVCVCVCVCVCVRVCVRVCVYFFDINNIMIIIKSG